MIRFTSDACTYKSLITFQGTTSYSSKLDTKTKEIEIYRNVLQGSSSNREFLQGLDHDIKTYGYDKVLEHYRNVARESRAEEERGKRN